MNTDLNFNNIVKEINILFNVPVLMIDHKYKRYKLVFIDIKDIDDFFKITINNQEINYKPCLKNSLCYCVNYFNDDNPIVMGYDSFDYFSNVINKALNRIYIYKTLKTEEKSIRRKYKPRIYSKSRFSQEKQFVI